MEKHFEYVIELDKLHEWVTAFRYDIAVRANVMCHHVNGSVADPSVRRPRFLDAAKAKTDSLKMDELLDTITLTLKGVQENVLTH